MTTPEEKRIEELSSKLPNESGKWEGNNQITQQLERARNKAYIVGYEAALKDVMSSLQSLALGIAETKKSLGF